MLNISNNKISEFIDPKAFKSGKTPGLQWRYTKTFLMYSDTQQESLISLLLKQDPSGIYKDPVH